ncbi:MAG: energy-coupling factor transporter ATP-binding protein EcfA2 [Pirellulaceae bacterium]|jgi:energy-coupling factor transporter ATP-binding protein EcfA2
MSDFEFNPFSTRFIRPDACEYVFLEQESLPDIFDRLTATGGWGQIIGPHGCGKSTLLNALKRHYESQNVEVAHAMLTSSSFSLQPLLHENTAQVLLDGYEQLNWWRRMRLKWRCRQRKCGLLVTCHQDLGLPTIATLQPNLKRLQRVVEWLIPNPADRPSKATLEQIYQVSNSDIRECLFHLYDWYEAGAEGT